MWLKERGILQLSFKCEIMKIQLLNLQDSKRGRALQFLCILIKTFLNLIIFSYYWLIVPSKLAQIWVYCFSAYTLEVVVKQLKNYKFLVKEICVEAPVLPLTVLFKHVKLQLLLAAQFVYTACCPSTKPCALEARYTTVLEMVEFQVFKMLFLKMNIYCEVLQLPIAQKIGLQVSYKLNSSYMISILCLLSFKESIGK